MRSVLVLGATGSIGTTALRAIEEGKLPVRVAGLVAHSSIERLQELGKKFNCPVALNDSPETLRRFVRDNHADIALNGIAGSAGLLASIICLEEGLDLALANKESIVMGGQFLLDHARKLGRRIIPVDSEHSAIYHLIRRYGKPSKLVITASGGPFLKRKDLENVTPQEAANHPTWKMGRKISIDSSTLANKGLEVIEAGFLFSMDAHDIEVVIHPQSTVHSMIRLANGAVYAQLSPPDMTLPIAAAVNADDSTLVDVVTPLSFSNLTLTFSDWDSNQFPLLSLAYMALEKKNGYPIAFNAADEVAVEAFCEGKIKYTEIAEVVRFVMERDWTGTAQSYSDIEKTDAQARKVALECPLFS